MPWCPKCKNEYVEEMTVCADCGVELVASLNETKGSPLIFGEQEKMERLKEFLLYNKLTSAQVAYDEADNVYELYVADEERQKAAKVVNVFMQQENEKEQKERFDKMSDEDKEEMLRQAAQEMEKQEPSVYKGPYQNSAKTAEENRSSGYMLISIGGIGLVVIVLLFLDIIVLPLNKYMVCGVMGALFVLFIVMGIMSMKSYKVLVKKAESENNLTTEIKKWCEANLTIASVEDQPFDQEESSEEIRYFKRIEKMKQMISHQFLNLDEDFLDAFIEDYYPVIYEAEEKE